MAILKYDQEVDYGDEEAETLDGVFSRPWNLEPYAPAGNTRYVRRRRNKPADSRRLSVSNFRFTNAIRAAADLWHNVLTQPERNMWLENNQYGAGQRPGMKMTTPNGWNLFAGYALAPLMLDVALDWEHVSTEGWRADHITLDQADSATQQFTLTRTYSGHVQDQAVNVIFVHQVDPIHILGRNPSRNTIACGYTTVNATDELVATFTANAIFPFNAGDDIMLLVREHVTSLEVNNRLLTIEAI